MPAGRPPKPIEAHIRDGTFVPSRHAGALVVPTERGLTDTTAPAHLNKDQRQAWDELVYAVHDLVRDTDRAVLEGAAVAFAQYREAQRVIDADGLMVTNRFDELKVHPAVAARDRALQIFLNYAGRLGLSPADRARLGLMVGGMAKTAKELLSDRYGDPLNEPPEGEVIDGVAVEVEE